MRLKIRKVGVVPVAVLMISSAALLTWGAELRRTDSVTLPGESRTARRAELVDSQEPAQPKTNPRESGQETASREENKRPPDATRYSYEFTQPQFYIRHIFIEHDAAGLGKLTFERQGEDTPISEPVELSLAALGRILGLWADLRFLDSSENYQSVKQFAHLGTMHFHMENGDRKRTAEFNWTNNKQAAALNNEYHRLADQTIFVFELSIARENQPLNTPKLMEQLDSLLSRSGLSDPYQLVPLLRDFITDEHVPLIARNHASRLLKRIEK